MELACAVNHIVLFWACWLSFGSEPCLVVLSALLRGGWWGSLSAVSLVWWFWAIGSLSSEPCLVVLSALPREGGWSSLAAVSHVLWFRPM